MKRTILWVVGIIIIIIVIAAVASKKTGDTGPIKIGMISPLSGNVAALGEIMKNVTDIAVAEINANGGVNERPLSIIYEDDQCSSPKSVGAVQKLTDIDKVKIIIGSTCSGSVLAMLPITDKSNTLLVTGAATSHALSNKSGTFARTIPEDSFEGLVLAQTVTAHDWKKVGVIQETSDVATSIYDSFASNYTVQKGTIVKEEYPAATTDFRTILTKIRATNPDILLINPQSPATAQKIMATLSQLNWKVPLLLTHVVSGNADFLTTNKAELEGALVSELSVGPANSKYIALEASYKKAYGKDMTYKAFAAAQYDLIYLLRDGVKLYGNDPAKIAAWLRTTTDYDGASGKLSIGTDGNRIGGYEVSVIKNGVAVPIE